MAIYDDDFQEIAHCGANTTISISSDDTGKRSFAIGLITRRPGPASMVGVYILLPDGIPVSDYAIGGIGIPFKPPPPAGAIPAILASDSRGCWGHQCPRCDGYFRNQNHAAIFPLTCPYCGLRAAAFKFLTPAQRKFLAHIADTLNTELFEEQEDGTTREVEIDMASLVDQASGDAKPDFYYASETQQTRYKCAHCDEFNDIRGLHGYCAACGWRSNQQTLELRFSEIRDSLNNARLGSEDGLRQCVSIFDATCRDFTKQLISRVPMKPSKKEELSRIVFHDIESAIFKGLKLIFDVDLMRGIQTQDATFIKMMLERRHLFEHNSGVIDERYIERSGDTAAILGQLIRESRENTHRLIGLLSRMAKNFDSDFHEIFPPTPWPIEHHSQQMARQRVR